MKIILSLGSNKNPEENIQMAEERLSCLFPAINFSKTLMNEPYNGDRCLVMGVGGMQNNRQNNLLSPNTQHPTPMFGNAIGVGETSLPESALRSVVKALERYLGRTPERKHQGIIDMDIDILQYGDMKMKPDDWQRSYNILLLKEFGL